MKKFITVSISLLLAACGQDQAPVESVEVAIIESAPTTENQVQVDRFADIQVLSYKVPGFDELSLREKKLVYYLSQAALSGWDII
jgi:dipeptidyl-peptidase-3